MDTSLQARILAVLDAQHVMALSTQRHDGFPQTTWVNFVHEGFTLYFASDAASQKAGNIARNPKVSAAIATETTNFYKLRGLSLSGLAEGIREREDAERIAPRPPITGGHLRQPPLGSRRHGASFPSPQCRYPLSRTSRNADHGARQRRDAHLHDGGNAGHGDRPRPV